MAHRFIGSYTGILRVNRSWTFSLAGWIGRMARSTPSISTILLVSGYSHSFAVAGAVSSAIVIGVAISGTLWSRAADARGQLRVLPVWLGASVVSAAALALAVVSGAAPWTWFFAAFLVGATSVDTGSLVRVRWASVLATAEQRHTALALEAVSDELAFVVGPPIVTLLAAVINPLFGFATGIMLGVAGGVWLWAQRSTAPAVRARDAHPRSRFLPVGIVGLIPIYLGIGGVFGSLDVTAVSVGVHEGNPALAGVILACFAVGSVTAGILFGPISAGWTAVRRILLSTVTYALVTPVLLLLQNVTALIAAIVVAGLVTTPVLISGTSFIASRVERHRLTEAMAWPSIGLSIGITVGATVAGSVIDNGSAFAGFVVSAVSAAVVGVFGVFCAARERSRAFGKNA